jgi:hypothetical protein
VLLKIPLAPQDGLDEVVLVQAHEGGRILGELGAPGS